MKIRKVHIGVALCLCTILGCDPDSGGDDPNSGSESNDSSGSETNEAESASTLTATATATATATETGAESTTDTTDSTAGESTSSTGVDPSTGDTSGTTGSTGTDRTSSSTGEAGSSSTGGDNFCPSTSPYNGVGECDPYAQDCPAGERCVPWANDGGTSWNATRCSPVEDDPGQLGDLCTVDGTAVSGVDTCDVGLMCFNVDVETNQGECVALCECGPNEALCEEEETFCSISNEGALPVCLGACDPLGQSCAAGEACYPIDDTFVCAMDASGDQGVQGDPCAFINGCDPGLTCSNPAGVPGCPFGSAGCCTAFCDLDSMTPECPISTECIPWFEEGSAPPGLENVGVCFIPV